LIKQHRSWVVNSGNPTKPLKYQKNMLKLKPFVRIGCLPQSSTTIQIDEDVFAALKALGNDWE